MKTRLFNWLLMAALVCGLSATVTSCKDDDDDDGKKSPEQVAEEQSKANDDANTFWSVAGKLINPSDFTVDYKDKQFEPNIGYADEGNALVRIVATNDLATAVRRFNDLTGANINENTTTYTWTHEAVGTLTWTRGDSRDYGIIDVDIKQIPKLQKIVYRDGDQMGTNRSFKGRAYYRFGDVVQKDGHYWVCVRPAFGPEKKQDSHWVCVDQLDEKNTAKCTKGGKTWYVPTGIGESTEHMKNFAEMLFAMFYPMKWYENLDNNPKLPLFNDFKHENIKYHNINFWQTVYENWKRKELFEKVFGVNEDKVRKAVDSSEGLKFICWGYSWWTSVSWNLTLKEYTYNGINMQDETVLKKEVNMRDKEPFDLRAKYWEEWAALEDFFEGDDGDLKNPSPRWIIRHAKGKDLDDDGYDEKEYLSGCDDTYTYYDDHRAINEDPEVTIKYGNGNIGEILGRNGNFYVTTIDAQYQGTTPVGIVIFRHTTPGIVDSDWNPLSIGLVMALQDAGEGKWDERNANDLKSCPYSTTIKDIKSIFENPENSDDRQGYWNNTNMLKYTTSCKHPASQLAADFNKANQVNSEKVSPWFLPTLGEMVLAFDDLARHPEKAGAEYAKYMYRELFSPNITTYESDLWKMFDDMFRKAYVPQNDKTGKSGIPYGSYWLATQTGDINACSLFVGNMIMLSQQSKTNKLKVRPICAFTN